MELIPLVLSNLIVTLSNTLARSRTITPFQLKENIRKVRGKKRGGKNLKKSLRLS